MKTVLLFIGLSASSVLTAQAPSPDSNGNQPTPAPQPVPPYQRPVSLGRIIPNVVDDQSKIWLFPAKLGTTAALIALDSHDAPYFRSASTFAGFYSVLTGNATAIGTAIVPVSLYTMAGEAVADSEILTLVLKDAFKRVRPVSSSPTSNFSDTWFESGGSLLSSNGGMPSGHAIAAFLVATIVARRYATALVGFSRLTLSAHFVSDVFVGGALGYSVSRFAVLQQ